MFAGVDFRPGDIVTPGDLVVPYVDVPWHNGVYEDDELGFLWNEYVSPNGRPCVFNQFFGLIYGVFVTSFRYSWDVAGM